MAGIPNGSRGVQSYGGNNSQSNQKPACVVSSTANVTLSSAPASFDDYNTLFSGVSRILIPFQTNATQNGIYIWNGAASAMTRSPDANTWNELVNATVLVQNGSVYGSTGWVCTIGEAGTIGVNNITWAQNSAPGANEFISPLVATGNQVNLTTVPLNLGGTGQITKSASFNALSPMTTLGDTIYGGASGTGTRLSGNTTTTKEFLSQTGDGVNSVAPSWSTVSKTDVGLSNVQNVDTTLTTNINVQTPFTPVNQTVVGGETVQVALQKLQGQLDGSSSSNSVVVAISSGNAGIDYSINASPTNIPTFNSSNITAVSGPSQFSVKGVNDTWLAGTTSGLYRSTNAGQTWVRIASVSISATINTVEYGMGYWVIGLVGGGGSNGIMYSADDGVTFAFTGITTGSISQILFANNYFIATRNLSSVDSIIYCNPASSITSWSTATGITGNASSILSASGGYIQVGSSATNGLFYSTNVTSYVASNITSGELYSITAANGVVLASFTSGNYVRSTDNGQTYTAKTGQSDSIFQYLSSNIWVSTNGRSGLVRSTDNGATFGSVITGTTGVNFFATYYFNGVLYLTSSTGLWYSLDDGLTVVNTNNSNPFQAYYGVVYETTTGKNNAAPNDPTVHDDISLGYSITSQWTNTLTNNLFICVENTLNAAVWISIKDNTPKNKITFTNTNAFFENNQYCNYLVTAITNVGQAYVYDSTLSAGYSNVIYCPMGNGNNEVDIFDSDYHQYGSLLGGQSAVVKVIDDISGVKLTVTFSNLNQLPINIFSLSEPSALAQGNVANVLVDPQTDNIELSLQSIGFSPFGNLLVGQYNDIVNISTTNIATVDDDDAGIKITNIPPQGNSKFWWYNSTRSWMPINQQLGIVVTIAASGIYTALSGDVVKNFVTSGAGGNYNLPTVETAYKGQNFEIYNIGSNAFYVINTTGVNTFPQLQPDNFYKLFFDGSDWQYIPEVGSITTYTNDHYIFQFENNNIVIFKDLTSESQCIFDNTTLSLGFSTYVYNLDHTYVLNITDGNSNLLAYLNPGQGAFVQYLKNDGIDTGDNFAVNIFLNTQTANQVLISDAQGNVTTSSTTATELTYVHGVTSAIQTQLNSKEPTITQLPINKGGTNSVTALNNNRIMESSGGAIIEAAAITANRAVISDANGIPTHSTVTNTELGYVSGVTSSIQTQLNTKEPTITAGTTAQYWRGDKTWQTLNTSAVSGLATVASTGAYSDLTGKPTLGTAAALDLATNADVLAGTSNVVLSSPAGLESAGCLSSGKGTAYVQGFGANSLTSGLAIQITGGTSTYTNGLSANGSTGVNLTLQRQFRVVFYTRANLSSGDAATLTITGTNCTVSTRGRSAPILTTPYYLPLTAIVTTTTTASPVITIVPSGVVGTVSLDNDSTLEIIEL